MPFLLHAGTCESLKGIAALGCRSLSPSPQPSTQPSSRNSCPAVLLRKFPDTLRRSAPESDPSALGSQQIAFRRVSTGSHPRSRSCSDDRRIQSISAVNSVSGTLKVCPPLGVFRQCMTSLPLLTGPVRAPVAVMILVVELVDFDLQNRIVGVSTYRPQVRTGISILV